MVCRILQGPKLSTTQRLHCIATNIRDTAAGLTPIWITSLKEEAPSGKNFIYRVVDSYLSQPVHHANKGDEVLKVLAKKLKDHGPFDSLSFTRREVFSLLIDGFGELRVWLDMLFREGLVQSQEFAALPSISQRNSFDISSLKFGITTKGWQRVERLFQGLHSDKAFIAMSFGHPERQHIQKAIESACVQTQWTAFTIDRKEYLGGITDEIIASINQSHFVIAEFTGNNQGVYYEAGYAVGKGIPVILLVKKEQVEKDPKGIHFDTRHINHIMWESYEDLTEKLKNRILAVLPKENS